ncbi:hypothetical protein [Arthrobacter sp. H35-D1]|uniref:hypothetical protein n=1 Tax=Arthrobacter sp. H35-D1 TaxID=3046202 RepID=UPI0024BAFFAF|nr:hypothetical protein [Arthrobacter sp. H35-D1]MDJ0313673.1 hypothetical protein [Arthrobacter sp. H35-D1]
MDALWIAAALVVAVLGGWPVTAGMLALAKSRPMRAVDAAESGVPTAPVETPAPETLVAASQSPETQSPETPAVAIPAPAPRVEVLRGGLLIGMLERAAVAVAILSGQPVAIAYVVAIKGLGRYPELKSTPAASERFIIGTLASMLFSASVAVLAKELLL